MVRWRAQRRWLWRANALLALLVVAGGWLALRPVPHVPAVAVATWTPRAVAESSGGPWIAWADLVQDVRRFVALPEEPCIPPAPRLPEPAPLSEDVVPLAAYEVRIWIHLPDEPDVVLLASKDPAHPRTIILREDQSVGDVRLVRVEAEGRRGRFHVRRGDEAFCYRFTTEADWSAPGLRAVRFGAPAAGDRGLLAGAAAPPPAADALDRDVKAVPYYGPDGALLGARVTGVRPGTWAARQGLRPGDVITALDEQPFPEAASITAHLRGVSRPERIEVRRLQDGQLEPVALGGS